jgi:hypothetical protein
LGILSVFEVSSVLHGSRGAVGGGDVALPSKNVSIMFVVFWNMRSLKTDKLKYVIAARDRNLKSILFIAIDAIVPPGCKRLQQKQLVVSNCRDCFVKKVFLTTPVKSKSFHNPERHIVIDIPIACGHSLIGLVASF